MTAPVPIFGLDVGRRQDPASLVLAYQHARPDGNHYEFCFVRQWKDVAYPVIAKDVRGIVTDPNVDQAAATLGIDVTAVGEPVADMIGDGLAVGVKKVWITGGGTWRKDEKHGCYNVAKSLLVSCVKALLAQKRLTIIKELQLAGLIVKELDNFQVKVSKAANELYEAREGQHDDLVLAIAVACWIGENCCVGRWDWAPNPAAVPLANRAPKGVFHCDEIGGDPYNRPFGE